MQANENFKKAGFKIMGILLFVASAIVTISYMLSNVMGIVACGVALIQGIGIESAKSFFSYIFIVSKLESQAGKKIIFGVLALLAFAISIVATTGFAINMSYKVQDFVLKKSDEYKNKQKFVTTQGDLYEETKKQLEDLKTQRDNQISKMEKVRDAWGKNYKSMKSLEQDKINSASAKYNDSIQTKENELQAIAGSLNQKTNESLKSEGFTGLYVVLAKYVNESRQDSVEQKPVESEDVSFWLNFAIAVCLEFFGIGFIYLSMREDSGTNYIPAVRNSNMHTAGFKPIATTASMSSFGRPDLHMHPEAYHLHPHSTPYPTEIKTTSVPNSNNSIEGRKIGFQYEPSPENKIYNKTVGVLQEPLLQDIGKTTILDKSTAGKIDLTKGVDIPIGGKIEHLSPTLPKSIDHKMLHIYLQYICDNVDANNLIPGYIKTARYLQSEHPTMKFDAETVRKLKAHCENLNILKSEKSSRKTFLIRSRDELKALTI